MWYSHYRHCSKDLVPVNWSNGQYSESMFNATGEGMAIVLFLFISGQQTFNRLLHQLKLYQHWILLDLGNPGSCIKQGTLIAVRITNDKFTHKGWSCFPFPTNQFKITNFPLQCKFLLSLSLCLLCACVWVEIWCQSVLTTRKDCCILRWR